MQLGGARGSPRCWVLPPRLLPSPTQLRLLASPSRRFWPRNGDPEADRLQARAAALDRVMGAAKAAQEAPPLLDFQIGAPYGTLCLAVGLLGNVSLVGVAGIAILGASWQSWQLWRQRRAFGGFPHWFTGALLVVMYQLGALAAAAAAHPALRLLLPATVLAGALYGLSAGGAAAAGAAPSSVGAPARAPPAGSSSSSSDRRSSGSGSAALAQVAPSSGSGGSPPDGWQGGGGGVPPRRDGGEGKDQKVGSAPPSKAPSKPAAPSGPVAGAPSDLRQVQGQAPAASLATNLRASAALTTAHSGGHNSGGGRMPPGGAQGVPVLHAAVAHGPAPDMPSANGAASPAAAAGVAGADMTAAAACLAVSHMEEVVERAVEHAVLEAMQSGRVAAAGGDGGSGMDEASGAASDAAVFDQAVIDHAVHVAFEHERESMSELVTQVVEHEMEGMNEMVAQAVEQAMTDVHFDVKANMNTLIVITGVILYWRGIWTAWDQLFGFGIWSEVGAIAIGLGIMILFRILKLPLAEGFPSG